MTLQRLLQPLSVAEFFAEFWEKQYLYISHAKNPSLDGFISGLVTLDDIDRLLTTVYSGGLRAWDSIRMGQDGVIIPPDMYLSRRNAGVAEIDVNRVLDLHRAGASIIINGVQRSLEGVGELCRSLSRSLCTDVHANIYLTPRAGQGFPVHFDPHDVFLLQAIGAKDWKLAQSPVPLATFEAKNEDQLIAQGDITTIRLSRGELLYIPRGFLHEGTTSDEISAHLTIGMNPITWADLIREMVNRLEEADFDFRCSVPVAAALHDTSTITHHQKSLEHLMRKLLEDDDLIRTSIERVSKERRNRNGAPLRGRLTLMHDDSRIGLDTLVRRHSCEPLTIQRAGGTITVASGSVALTLPAFVERHVSVLCAGEPIRGMDLPRGIDEDGKLVLVRRLVREGILIPVAQ